MRCAIDAYADAMRVNMFERARVEVYAARVLRRCLRARAYAYKRVCRRAAAAAILRRCLSDFIFAIASMLLIIITFTRHTVTPLLIFAVTLRRHFDAHARRHTPPDAFMLLLLLDLFYAADAARCYGDA